MVKGSPVKGVDIGISGNKKELKGIGKGLNSDRLVSDLKKATSVAFFNALRKYKLAKNSNQSLQPKDLCHKIPIMLFAIINRLWE